MTNNNYATVRNYSLQSVELAMLWLSNPHLYAVSLISRFRDYLLLEGSSIHKVSLQSQC